MLASYYEIYNYIWGWQNRVEKNGEYYIKRGMIRECWACAKCKLLGVMGVTVGLIRLRGVETNRLQAGVGGVLKRIFFLKKLVG